MDFFSKNKEQTLKVNISVTKLLYKSTALTQMLTLFLRNPDDNNDNLAEFFLRNLANLRIAFKNYIKKTSNPHFKSENPEILGKQREILGKQSKLLGKQPEFHGKQPEILEKQPENLGKLWNTIRIPRKTTRITQKTTRNPRKTT